MMAFIPKFFKKWRFSAQTRLSLQSAECCRGFKVLIERFELSSGSFGGLTVVHLIKGLVLWSMPSQLIVGFINVLVQEYHVLMNVSFCPYVCKHRTELPRFTFLVFPSAMERTNFQFTIFVFLVIFPFRTIFHVFQ